MTDALATRGVEGAGVEGDVSLGGVVRARATRGGGRWGFPARLGGVRDRGGKEGAGGTLTNGSRGIETFDARRT